MALPIYSPYGTVQNSFQQFMGEPQQTGPINYNVPLSGLRTQNTQPTISTFSDLNDEELQDAQAQNVANKTLGQLQGQNLVKKSLWENSLNLLGNLKVGRDTAANLYDGAYQFGLTSQKGPSYNNQREQGVLGSTLYNSTKNNQALNRANAQADMILAGVDPNQVDRAYQKFLKNNQF